MLVMETARTRIPCELGYGRACGTAFPDAKDLAQLMATVLFGMMCRSHNLLAGLSKAK